MAMRGILRKVMDAADLSDMEHAGSQGEALQEMRELVCHRETIDHQDGFIDHPSYRAGAYIGVVPLPCPSARTFTHLMTGSP